LACFRVSHLFSYSPCGGKPSKFASDCIALKLVSGGGGAAGRGGVGVGRGRSGVREVDGVLLEMISKVARTAIFRAQRDPDLGVTSCPAKIRTTQVLLTLRLTDDTTTVTRKLR